MSKGKSGHKRTLVEKYPPSEPCTCRICVGYCARPGWWTVEQAARALGAGLGGRIMLEIAPELTFGVLSPAFKGCERSVAVNQFARRGCTFLRDERCELFGTGHEPLECRFCHHDRRGQGSRCHADLEKDWRAPAGQALVETWLQQHGLKTLFGGKKDDFQPARRVKSVADFGIRINDNKCDTFRWCMSRPSIIFTRGIL